MLKTKFFICCFHCSVISAVDSRCFSSFAPKNWRCSINIFPVDALNGRLKCLNWVFICVDWSAQRYLTFGHLLYLITSAYFIRLVGRYQETVPNWSINWLKWLEKSGHSNWREKKPCSIIHPNTSFFSSLNKKCPILNTVREIRFDLAGRWGFFSLGLRPERINVVIICSLHMWMRMKSNSNNREQAQPIEREIQRI